MSLLASGVILTGSDIATGSGIKPRRYVSLIFLYIMLAFVGAGAPQIAIPLAYLIALGVLFAYGPDVLRRLNFS